MKKALAVGVGLLLLLLFVLKSTTYTVRFNEVAIRATFGRASSESVVRDPGLHYQWPIFIDKVTKLDTRLQLVESPYEEITTRDDLQIVVRGFMLWRVRTAGDGPYEFFTSFGDITRAGESLPADFRTAMTGALSRYDFDHLIGASSRIEEVENAIKGALAQSLSSRGIEPVTVGISQLMLPARTTQSVLDRMTATRDVLARNEESKGSAEAERIRSEAKTKVDKISAFAQRRADDIRAQGQEQAAAYLRQMSADEDLAIFLVWLDALQSALGDYTTLVLPTQEAPWHLMNPQGVSYNGPIPVPTDGQAPRIAGGDGQVPAAASAVGQEQ